MGNLLFIKLEVRQESFNYKVEIKNDQTFTKQFIKKVVNYKIYSRYNILKTFKNAKIKQ